MTTRNEYNSFIDFAGFPSSGSHTSHSTGTGSHTQRQYFNPQRDQQIFRRATSNSNEGRGDWGSVTGGTTNFKIGGIVDDGVNLGRGGQPQPQPKPKHVFGDSFTPRRNNERTANTGNDWYTNHRHRSPLSSEWNGNIKEQNYGGSPSPNQYPEQMKPQSTYAGTNLSRSSKSLTSLSPLQTSKPSPIQSSTNTAHVSNSGSGSVVTKLVSFFSHSKSIHSSTTTALTDSSVGSAKIRSSSPTNPTLVRFHNIADINPPPIDAGTKSTASYPTISPARSNTQSSTSGGESSYNPTGWPGTIDKKGRTYAMEPSYSESEEGSLNCSTAGSSPRNRMRGVRTENGGVGQQKNAVNIIKRINFEDGDSQAELEEWIKCDNNRREVHPAGRNSSLDPEEGCPPSRFAVDGWRAGHQQTLADISETRRAADCHIESMTKLSSVDVGGFRFGSAQDGDKSHSPRKQPSTPVRRPLPTNDEANVSGSKSVRSSSSRDVDEHGYPAQHSFTRDRRTSPTSEILNVSGAALSNSCLSPLIDEDTKLRGIDTSLSEKRVRASGKRLGSSPRHTKVYNDEVNFDDEADFGCSPDSYNVRHLSCSILNHQPPTEEALRMNDSRCAPHSQGGSTVFKGYRGFIEKTRDVPNLMDDLESEAGTSFGTPADTGGTRHSSDNSLGLSLPSPLKSSAVIERRNNVHGKNNPPSYSNALASSNRTPSVVSFNVDSGSDVFDGLHGSEVGGSTPAFPSRFNSFGQTHSSHRQSNNYKNMHPNKETESCFDPFVDISAVTNGSKGSISNHDIVDFDYFKDGLDSLPDLSIYCIQPEMVRLMVRAFRKMCTMQMEISSSEDTMLSDFEDLVDTKKRFALFEMRSRIMETDIDRGLERRGGTNVVDDIVLTPYFQAQHRVRDAVIVSKAWRDGATPKDVVTAHLLTRRGAKSHFVRRPIMRSRRPGGPSYPEYWFEEVTWLDETDFSLMKCQSLGAGRMYGFEMFTIGDCQSILLKMTSENCTQLRRELRSAMRSQIEAEEVMQEEIDLDGEEQLVAEAEQIYRDTTNAVKQLSMKLVLADRAFSLVRSRMERLVETIESLLVHMENDADTHEVTSSSSQSGTEIQESLNQVTDLEEREKLVERAKRAEMSAEIAIRETILAKQEAEKIKAEKQREIDDLKDKLAEMETQSQHLASRFSSILANSRTNSSYFDKIDARSILEGSFDRDMADAQEAARNRVKTKFRERRATHTPKDNEKPRSKDNPQLNGDELYQHLDFYSRSLKAVM